MIVISLSFFEEIPQLSYYMSLDPLAVETKSLTITKYYNEIIIPQLQFEMQGQ